MVAQTSQASDEIEQLDDVTERHPSFKCLVPNSWFYPKYIEEGMAITHLFTFGRGWGHDVTMIHMGQRVRGKIKDGS